MQSGQAKAEKGKEVMAMVSNSVFAATIVLVVGIQMVFFILLVQFLFPTELAIKTDWDCTKFEEETCIEMQRLVCGNAMQEAYKDYKTYGSQTWCLVETAQPKMDVWECGLSGC